jgi:uncharacterized phage protein gp47/JayE
MTYEVILRRMLDRVTAKYPNLDTREGSVIFNALAPAALELAIAYVDIDHVLAESFVATATRQYLYVGCEQMGMDVSVFDANAGEFKGEFDVEVPIGSRWNCDLYNYTITSPLGYNDGTGMYEYRMLCETVGTAPNKLRGSLSAITDLPSTLTHAELVDCLVEGEDEYTDEEIKEAYFEFVNSTASDGNVGQYERWCAEYEGIGNYKIFPLWNGKNTVKVSILSASNRAASPELVADFQNYLDPNTTAMGDGKAPIGAFVTVSTATELPVNVTANIKLANGYTSVPDIDTALTNFFSKIAYEKNVLSYMSLGAAILDVPGVEFIADLKVNGGTSDITLGDEQIPLVGETTWTVVS